MHNKKLFTFTLAKNSYVLATVLLITWVTFAYFLSQQIIANQEQYGKLINLSGKQRMLSQKTALSVLKHTVKASKEELVLLDSLIVQMQVDHLFILNNLPSQILQNFYTQDSGLTSEVNAYFILLQEYLKAPKTSKAKEISLASQELLPKLDNAVALFVEEHTLLVKHAEVRTLFIYIGTIITLLLIALFIIRPMAKKTQNYTQELEDEVQTRLQEALIYATIFDNSHEGMVLTDSEEKIIKVNNAFTKITGYLPEEAVGQTPRILQSGLQNKDFYKNMWQQIESEGIWSGKITNKNSAGQNYNEFLTILKLYNQELDVTNYVSIFTDLTKLHETLDKFQKLIDLQSNIIIITNGKTILFANKRFYEFSGFENLESFFKRYTCVCDMFIVHENFFHLEQVPSYQHWMKYLASIPEEKRVVSMLNRNNEPKAFKIMIDAYDDDTSIIVFTDISKNFIEKEKLRTKAQTDRLTGCYNREYLYDVFLAYTEQKIVDAKQTGLILLDIDNFKSINDTYGHNRGDEVLKTLSKVIHQNSRGDDILIRWGGEEFIILCTATSFLEIIRVAEKFRKLLEEEHFEEIEHITCSFGVTTYRFGEQLEATVERADQALYKAKKSGKNRVEIIEDIL